MSKRARPQGFTLIELLIVVAIIGLLGIIAVPSSGTGYAFRLDAAEIQVRDAMNRAMHLARSTREPHGVVFDTSGNRFAVVDGDGEAVTDPLTKRGYIIDFARPDQPQGIAIVSAAFGANGTAAIFDGEGLPLEAGVVHLTCKTNQRQLSLDKATGQLESL